MSSQGRIEINSKNYLKTCEEQPISEEDSISTNTIPLEDSSVQITPSNFDAIVTQLEEKAKNSPLMKAALESLIEGHCLEIPKEESASAENSQTAKKTKTQTPTQSVEQNEATSITVIDLTDKRQAIPTFRFSSYAFNSLVSLLTRSNLSIEDIPIPEMPEDINSETYDTLLPDNEETTENIDQKEAVDDTKKTRQNLQEIKKRLESLIHRTDKDNPDTATYVYTNPIGEYKPLRFNADERAIMAEAMMIELNKLDLNESDLKDYMFLRKGTLGGGRAQVVFSTKISPTQYDQIISAFQSYFGNIDSSDPLASMKQTRLQKITAELNKMKQIRGNSVKANYPLPILEGINPKKLQEYIANPPPQLPANYRENKPDDFDEFKKTYIKMNASLDPRDVAQIRARMGSPIKESLDDINSFASWWNDNPPVVIQDGDDPSKYWIRRTDYDFIGLRWFPVDYPAVDIHNMDEIVQVFKDGSSQCEDKDLDTTVCNYFDIKLGMEAERIHNKSKLEDPWHQVSEVLPHGIAFALGGAIVGYFGISHAGGGGPGGFRRGLNRIGRGIRNKFGGRPPSGPSGSAGSETTETPDASEADNNEGAKRSRLEENQSRRGVRFEQQRVVRTSPATTAPASQSGIPWEAVGWIALGGALLLTPWPGDEAGAFAAGARVLSSIGGRRAAAAGATGVAVASTANPANASETKVEIVEKAVECKEGEEGCIIPEDLALDMAASAMGVDKSLIDF
ncbi:MAG: hypothetical protein H7A32_00595 [Deltaproteobacteria bacterium]|nr:hypothetical protein [Deltaproteobacteria bacterium]